MSLTTSIIIEITLFFARILNWKTFCLNPITGTINFPVIKLPYMPMPQKTIMRYSRAKKMNKLQNNLAMAIPQPNQFRSCN